MDWIDQCIAQFEKQRSALNVEIEMLQSGQVRTQSKLGGYWEDTTAECLTAAKSDLKQIELLLAEYAKRKP